MPGRRKSLVTRTKKTLALPPNPVRGFLLNVYFNKNRERFSYIWGMKIGDRVYNLHFGWGTVMLPPTTDKLLVDLDAKTIDYYVMGKGRVQYHRNEETGQHPLRAPLSEFYDHPDEIPKDDETYLKKMCLSAKITL